MRRSAVHILLLLSLLAALTGCGRKARVIPERKMVRLYADMFLSDQWVRDNPNARKVADTTLLFDPIFRSHGVTFEDYDRSVHYYLDHPDKYAKILSRASDALRKESERLKTFAEEDRARQSELDHFHRLYQPKDFSTDSLRWSGPQTLWPVYTEPVADADTVRVEEPVHEEILPAVQEGRKTWEPVKPQDPRERPVPRRVPLDERANLKLEER